RYWPWVKSNSARSSSRGASVTTTASRVSRRTSVTFNGWKRAMWVSSASSDAFEIVEGFQTVLAAVAGLAGGGSELADLFRMGRSAARAGDHQIRGARQPRDAPRQPPVRRRAVDGGRDTIGAQLFPPLGRDPVGGPGRRKLP